jgi:hypothetical protein
MSGNLGGPKVTVVFDVAGQIREKERRPSVNSAPSGLCSIYSSMNVEGVTKRREDRRKFVYDYRARRARVTNH